VLTRAATDATPAGKLARSGGRRRARALLHRPRLDPASVVKPIGPAALARSLVAPILLGPGTVSRGKNLRRGGATYESVSDIRPFRLIYKSYLFFFYNKSANNIFSHGLSAKRTGQ